MSKSMKKTNCKKKEVIVIFVEGDTEVDFYKKLMGHIRTLCGGTLSCNLSSHNLKGVGGYQNKAQRIFERKVKVSFPETEYYYKVFLCYDTDVFEYSKKPPVDWKKVISALGKLGADEVYQISAKSSIEDWFLYDSDGLRSYLKLPTKTDMSGYKGQNGLKQLFAKANKTYIKGVKCVGLVDSLSMKIIFPKICNQIHVICEAAGLDCSKVKICNS